MGYAELVGLTGEARKAKLREMRKEANTKPVAHGTVSEGRVSVELKKQYEEWDGSDLCNDETLDEKKQRAKNRQFARQAKFQAKYKYRSYWNRPTENEALR